MSTKKLVIGEFVKEQIKRWETADAKEDTKGEVRISVLTVSMEPGSGGSSLAEVTAKRLGFDYFNRDIVEGIAKSAQIRASVIDTLEKERLSGIQDFISSLIKEHYIYPGIYLEHLLKIISTIGKHGRAVIVGRGANFILPPNERFSIRVVAPLELRIQNVARRYGVTIEKAKQRVIGRESKRRAFVRQSFNADISDPKNYDLTINTARMSIEDGVNAVIGAVVGIPKIGKRTP
ncbi:MAG: cytidylate kinase-like family protein [Desulfobacterales bacterium]|jgi:cytidylate kinase